MLVPAKLSAKIRPNLLGPAVAGQPQLLPFESTGRAKANHSTHFRIINQKKKTLNQIRGVVEIFLRFSISFASVSNSNCFVLFFCLPVIDFLSRNHPEIVHVEGTNSRVSIIP
ncbi:hypothetical protein Dimus_014650 [Dionaea muscipula]